jgi:hypothetical protein
MIALPFELVAMVLPVITVAPVCTALPLMVTWPAFTVRVPVQPCASTGSTTGFVTSGAANELRVKTVATAIARAMLIEARW